MGEDSVERLSFSQTAYIVKTCVEGLTFTLVALNTTARLQLAFENQNPLASLSQQVGTDKSTETASYDDNIVSHTFFIYSG
jgi:hypothetical protein